MKPHVLLCKRTGNLVCGYRICFVDDCTFLSDRETPFKDYSIILAKPDGWLIEHPETGPFKYYMNGEWVESNFENLGEL